MSRWLIYVAAGLAMLMGGAGATSFAVAYPVLAGSFNASLMVTGFVLTLYMLAATAAAPLMGRLSDSVGRKPAFMASASLFVLGSALSAIAPNVQLLIVFRIIQGIGGGGIIPCSVGVTAETFPERRQQLVGLLNTLNTTGMVIGPNVGGWLVSAYGWRSVFWINIVIGAIVLLIAAFRLKSGKAKGKAKVDLAGVGLLTGALLALMTGLGQLRSGGSGLSWVLTGILLGGGVAMAYALARHCRARKDAIIDWQLLRDKRFGTSNIYSFASGWGIFTVLTFIPLYAVSVYGMSTLESGFIATPRPIASIAVTGVTSVFLMRWGYRWPMIAGATITVATYTLLALQPQGLTLFGAHVGSVGLLTMIMFLAGLSAVSGPAFNNARIDLAPARAGSISGVAAVFVQIGAMMGMTTTSMLLSTKSDASAAFAVVFFIAAGLITAVFPLIFLLPKRPVKAAVVQVGKGLGLRPN